MQENQMAEAKAKSRDADPYARLTDSLTVTRKTSEKRVLELGKKCEKCGHCCSMSSGFVLPNEIQKIADFLKISKDEVKDTLLEEVYVFDTRLFRVKRHKMGKPYGECLLLDKDNRCSINAVKPLHCRIGNCSKHGEQLSIWYMLNHAVDISNPNSIREWAIYLENHPTIPGGRLEDLIPDSGRRNAILNHQTEPVFKGTAGPQHIGAADDIKDIDGDRIKDLRKIRGQLSGKKEDE